MNDFDPVTLARLRFLSHEVTADDYARAILDFNTSLGEDVLASPDLPKGTELRTKLVMRDTRFAFDAITRILTTIARTEEQRENLVFLMAKTIDDSLNLGAFYMADRPKEDLPAPITAEEIAREMARRGGKRSVEKRQEALSDGWHKYAKELALQIRAEMPAIAQRALAAEIGERWKVEGFKPGPDSLRNFISTCESNGSIPRRKV